MIGGIGGGGLGGGSLGGITKPVGDVVSKVGKMLGGNPLHYSSHKKGKKVPKSSKPKSKCS
jgi:hypothetical protein